MDQTLDDSISFQWHITDLCNLRCKHCYQENFKDDNDLSLDKIKIIINNLSLQFNKISVNITGGEPLFKKDLFEILDILSESKQIKRFNIITNGTLLNLKNIEKLEEYKKLEELKISIDGIKLNDLIRGNGILQIVSKNIKIIKNIKKIIMFTASSINYSEIEDVIQYSNENADGIIIERFVPLGTGLNMKDAYLKSNEWEYIVRYISDIYQIENLNELAKFRAFYIDFYSDEIYGALCNIGESFAIMPDGTIYPCRRLPINLGNALNEFNIKKKINDFRRMIEENLDIKCKSCKNFNECIGCRAGVYAIKNNLFYFDEQCII